MNNNELINRIHLPFDIKLKMSIKRIQEAYQYTDGKMYISFSGGRDSTVLLHLVRSIYPEMKAFFINTGVEYPEIVKFVKTFDNVEIIRPKMTIKKVFEKYGYPCVSKEQSLYIYDIRHTKSEKLYYKRMDGSNYHISNKWKYLVNAPFEISGKCCDILKKQPSKIIEKKYGLYPYLGIRIGESQLRKNNYIRNGCNSFKTKRIYSAPLSIWTDNDIKTYINTYNVKICDIYKYYNRTGCYLCMFGLHLQKQPNRMQMLQITHPKLWNYAINKLGLGKILEHMKINYKYEQYSLM